MKRTSLSKQLLIGLLLVILLQAILVSVGFSINAMNNVKSNMERSACDLLTANRQLVDIQLKDLDMRVNHLMTDSLFYEMVYELSTSRYASGIDWKSEMRRLVFNYLGDVYYNGHDDLIDINIVAPTFTYSNHDVTAYSYGNLVHSDMYDAVVKNKMNTTWFPTTSIVDFMPRVLPRYRSQVEKTQSFRYIKQLNISMVRNKVIQVIPPNVTKPFLIMDISPSVFASTFGNGTLTDHSTWLVLDESGHIISTEDIAGNGVVRDMTQLRPLLSDTQLTQSYVKDNGESIMVSCVRSSVTPWYYLLLIPTVDITQRLSEMLVVMLLVVVVMMGATSLLVIFFVRRKMQPVRQLTQKAEVMAKENGVLALSSWTDVDRIDHMLDRMNEQIDLLSRENKEVERRERDATILMLEMQINPHFLYNSLNKIHLRLLQIGQDKLASSVYDLAQILRFSINTKKHVVYLSAELDYLQRYLDAIRTEQTDRFSVYFTIDPRLQDAIVPKMLLQPFVENTILHGFRDMAYGGIITIDGSLKDGVVLLTVTDNGAGIAADKLNSIVDGQDGKIGCANVHKRIQLLYGSEYGVSASSDDVGTVIRIRLPFVSDQQS